MQYLVNDSAAGFPESDSVLGSRGGQKIVDLLVGDVGQLQICHSSILPVPGRIDSTRVGCLLK
jgi:hypothetical protein